MTNLNYNVLKKIKSKNISIYISLFKQAPKDGLQRKLVERVSNINTLSTAGEGRPYFATLLDAFGATFTSFHHLPFGSYLLLWRRWKLTLRDKCVSEESDC